MHFSFIFQFSLSKNQTETKQLRKAKRQTFYNLFNNFFFISVYIVIQIIISPANTTQPNIKIQV